MRLQYGDLTSFQEDFAAQQVMQAGTLMSQTTFIAYPLRGATHRSMDVFVICPVVAAEQVM